MKISLAIFVIFGLSLAVEGQKWSGKRPGGGGRGGKGKKGPNNYIEKICGEDGELDLQCEKGEFPKLFKGSACADISDGDTFPGKEDLTNPCEGGADVSTYRPGQANFKFLHYESHIILKFQDFSLT